MHVSMMECVQKTLIIATHRTTMTVGGIIERNRIHMISNFAVRHVHKCSLEHTAPCMQH